VALANLAAAAAVNVGLFLLVFRVLTPRQIPTRQLVAGALVAGVAWQVLQAVGGYLVGHYLRHTSQVYGVFAIVLGLLFWLYLGAQLTYTPQRSTSWPPDGSGRGPATTTPGPRRPRSLDLADLCRVRRCR
jgi:exosortase/archaeosortase